MRPRSWVLLAVGLALSVLTGVALYRVATQAQAAPVATASSTQVTAVFAKADIPARTVITAAMVMTKEVPAALLPAGTVPNEGEAIGQTTLAPIPAGSFVFKALLLSATGRTGSSLTVEPGKVLVAFPTTDPLTTAGFVAPGDRIDLLATVTSGAGETSRKTQTIVQNLEVVDVLRASQQNPQQQLALTFQVDHQVALFLKFLRDSQAQIEIAVRSRDESEGIQTQSVNIKVLTDTFEIK